MQHSYKDFFADIIKTHGVDFSKDFRYAELSKMARNVVWLFEQLSIRFTQDTCGDTVLLGIDLDKSVRVKGTWNALVSTLGNSEIIDETALNAFRLNPEAKKGLDACLERAQKLKDDETREKILRGINILKDKYDSSR